MITQVIVPQPAMSLTSRGIQLQPAPTIQHHSDTDADTHAAHSFLAELLLKRFRFTMTT